MQSTQNLISNTSQSQIHSQLLIILLGFPLATIPTTYMVGFSLFYYASSKVLIFSAFVLMAMYFIPTGTWSVIGFLITLRRVCDELTALILRLFNNYAISPANLLYVLGIFVLGSTYMSTFSWVLINTLTFPVLFNGESKMVIKLLLIYLMKNVWSKLSWILVYFFLNEILMLIWVEQYKLFVDSCNLQRSWV